MLDRVVNTLLVLQENRMSPPQVFSGESVLKICRKFTGEHLWKVASEKSIKKNKKFFHLFVIDKCRFQFLVSETDYVSLWIDAPFSILHRLCCTYCFLFTETYAVTPQKCLKWLFYKLEKCHNIYKSCRSHVFYRKAVRKKILKICRKASEMKGPFSKNSMFQVISSNFSHIKD